MILFPLNFLAAFQQKRRRCRKCRERVEIWGFLAMIWYLWRGPESPRRRGTGCPGLRGTGSSGPGQGKLRAREGAPGRVAQARINHGAGFTPLQVLCSAWRGQKRLLGGAQQAEPRPPQIPPERTLNRCVPSGLPGTSPFLSRSPLQPPPR